MYKSDGIRGFEEKPLAADVTSQTFTHTHILVVRRGHRYLYKSLWRRHTNRLWLCVYVRLVTSPASGERGGKLMTSVGLPR